MSNIGLRLQTELYLGCGIGDEATAGGKCILVPHAHHRNFQKRLGRVVGASGSVRCIVGSNRCYNMVRICHGGPFPSKQGSFKHEYVNQVI